jgi:hypothetical protein
VPYVFFGGFVIYFGVPVVEARHFPSRGEFAFGCFVKKFDVIFVVVWKICP